MAQLPSLAAVEEILEALGERGYARRLGRRPGQKEDRFMQLLGGEGATGDDGRAEPPASAPYVVAEPGAPSLSDRVAALEAEVALLREQLRSAAPAPPGT